LLGGRLSLQNITIAQSTESRCGCSARDRQRTDQDRSRQRIADWAIHRMESPGEIPPELIEVQIGADAGGGE
jgi:hypothetical protein